MICFPDTRVNCGTPGVNPDIPGIELGLQSITDTFLGDSFTFSCENGYPPTGGSGMTADTNVVCLESRVWDYGNLECFGKNYKSLSWPIGRKYCLRT